MNITCPACGTAIPAANINIQERLALCPQCSTVFPFEPPPPRKAKPRKVRQPDFVTVDERADVLELSFRWWHMLQPGDRIVLALFTAAALAPAIVALAVILSATTLTDALLGSILIPIALLLFYPVLVALVDRLHIHAGDTTLRTRFAPLPIWTRADVDLDDVVDVRVAASTSRRARQRDTGYYNVQAVCRDGQVVTLTTLHHDLASYVAGVLNDYLAGDAVADLALDLAEDTDRAEPDADGEVRLADELARQDQQIAQNGARR